MCNKIFIICKTVYIIKRKNIYIKKLIIIDLFFAYNLWICLMPNEKYFVIFPGAEDVVMAFSRSETEDRRQWPLAMPSHYSWTQHCWLMERAEPETREGRGSAACQLPHFPSLPHSPLRPHTNCYTIGPCGRTTWWLVAKESWRVKIWFGFLSFGFASSFRKWRFIFVPMRDLMDQELNLSGQTTKEYKSPYGLCYYRWFSFSVYVGSCFNCPQDPAGRMFFLFVYFIIFRGFDCLVVVCIVISSK